MRTNSMAEILTRLWVGHESHNSMAQIVTRLWVG